MAPNFRTISHFVAWTTHGPQFNEPIDPFAVPKLTNVRQGSQKAHLSRLNTSTTMHFFSQPCMLLENILNLNKTKTNNLLPPPSSPNGSNGAKTMHASSMCSLFFLGEDRRRQRSSIYPFPPATESHMTQPPQDSTPNTATAAAAESTSRSPSPVPVTLLQPSQRKPLSKPARLFRTVRSAFRSFPIFTPVTCRLPHVALHHRGGGLRDGHIHGATRTTGTLFGHRKARITLAIQDNPRSVPLLLLELAAPTAKFLQDMGSSGHFRVALECEKKAADRTRLLDEPMWTTFINGKNIGPAARREPNNSDLSVMQLLHAVSMGAGVLPADMTDPVDGELTFMRTCFDRVVNSRDSETFYMFNPDENSHSELSIFFVRI